MSTECTLIHGRWIAPIRPQRQLLEHHSLVVQEQKILGILPTPEAKQRYAGAAEHTLDQHLLIPGLVNSHSHAAMSLFRGMADDLPLMDWLQNHIWPAEGQWVSEDFVAQGVTLAIAEMLRSGTTCFNDMYFFPDVAAQTAQSLGMRASIGLIILDFPTVWAKDAEHYLARAEEVYNQPHSELISFCLAPHAPYTVSDQPLRQAQAFAERWQIPLQMHIHETAFEVAEAEQQQGQRPLARLEQLGLLTPQLQAVHMTQLTEAEIKRLAETGAHVVHCPESNLKLASGFCPVSALLQAGVNVALGTDGAASNNDLDMLGEMRTAALLAKAVAQDATAVDAWQALEMATLSGAKALGLDQHIGSLEPGKAADISAIDLSALSCQPVYHPVSQLVYAASRDQVSHVWVNGQLKVDKGQLVDLDPQQLQAQAQAWADKIQQQKG